MGTGLDKFIKWALIAFGVMMLIGLISYAIFA